ncbi:hypothetical protein FKP32DRAFT_223601 [Trametes sanguinea]|nr:hypothetical protein FKP32DRAFT_223601 [Trametes sanguinea]
MPLDNNARPRRLMVENIPVTTTLWAVPVADAAPPRFPDNLRRFAAMDALHIQLDPGHELWKTSEFLPSRALSSARRPLTVIPMNSSRVVDQMLVPL